jgi:hypothetical protein
MKPRLLFLAALLFVFISGCMVFSFYPLYTEEDLFPNDLLVGEWVDSDSAIWKFDFNYKGKRLPENRDSTAFILQIKEKGNPDFDKASFIIHLIKLEGTYFLDFYLENYLETEQLTFFDMHLLPVHSFAKLELNGDSAKMNWFSPEWLEELIKQNRIRIHHENNGNHILLTAKPHELQKFVVKYVNSEDAFEKGVDAELRRVKK